MSSESLNDTHAICKTFVQQNISQNNDTKAERYVTLWKSHRKIFAGCDPSFKMIYLTWLEYFASVLSGIYFYHFFYDMVWNSHQFKRRGATFSSLSLSVIIKQTHKFLKNLNVQSFSLSWSRWDNFKSDPNICKYN